MDPLDVLHLDPVKPRGWDNVKHLILKIFRRWDGKLSSFKQAKVLRKYGYKTEVSFAEASATIDALERNGWRRAKAEGGNPMWNQPRMNTD